MEIHESYSKVSEAILKNGERWDWQNRHTIDRSVKIRYHIMTKCRNTTIRKLKKNGRSGGLG